MNFVRKAIFAGVAIVALPLGTVGCGKPTPPPKGAPTENQEAPSIDLGNPSGAPKDNQEAPSDPSSASGTPKGDQGDK